MLEEKRVHSSSTIQAALSVHNRAEIIKGIVGLGVKGNTPVLNTGALLHFNTKSIVYSFKKVNNIYPILTKTEYLLKCLFQSMFSLISKPVYLINHDKIIIRLFVFLSPKLDKYLDTTTRSLRDLCSIPHYLFPSTLWQGARGSNWLTSTNAAKGGTIKFLSLRAKNLTKIKNIRPQIIEILKYQIKYNPRLWRGNDSYMSTFPYRSARDVHMNTLVSNFNLTLERLSLIFGKIFNKKVEFEIIKAQLPFQDSNILAQILGYNANKYKFRRMLKILIPRAVIKNPSKQFTAGSVASLTPD